MKYHSEECRTEWTLKAIELSEACDMERLEETRPAIDRFMAFIGRTHMMDRAGRCRLCGTALPQVEEHKEV